MNQWKNASEATKKSVYVLVIIFGLIIIIVPTVWWQNTKKAESRMKKSTFNETSTLDTLIIDFKISTVNTDDYTYTLLMNLKPTGRLANQNGNLTRFELPMDLTVKGERFSFLKNSPTSAIEFKSNFAIGTSNSFPFDIYQDEFDISGVLVNGTGASFVSIIASYTGTFDSFDADVHVDSFSTKSFVRLQIERTGTTKFFSVSVVILMWALSSSILTLAVTIWIRKRIVEPSTIAVAAGLLFAIPQLRNVQPGIPSIGCASDTVGFFWNMALIAVALLLLMWNYIIHKKEKDFPGKLDLSHTVPVRGKVNLPSITTTYPRKAIK